MIRLVDARKAFGATVAVDGLSLEVREGEVFGLLGPNGAGKTTTVGMLAGLLAPDEGLVEIGDGASPLEPDRRAAIGVAPQALALYEEMSGRENLSFFGRIQGLSGGRLRERVAWALDFVELAGRAGDRVGKYSGGMKRRLNLAVALVHDPPVILLDEPTVGVDPQSRNAIFDNIGRLRSEGRTIVYTTHYMEEAERLCDRVGILDHGRLLACDSVDGLIEAHGGDPVLVVGCGGEERRVEARDPLDELLRLREAGTLTWFRQERPDLEQVFLNLTGRSLRDA